MVQVHCDVTVTDKAAFGRQIHGGTGARYRKTPTPILLAWQIAEVRIAKRLGVRAGGVFCEEVTRYFVQNLTLSRMAGYALPARRWGLAALEIEPAQLGTRRPFDTG